MNLIEALAEIERLKANAEKGKRKYQKQLTRLRVAVAHRDNFKRQLLKATTNAERYEKLRRWMSSNVHEGWGEVQKLAGIACYIGWDDFDKALDALPVCNVGLCEIEQLLADNPLAENAKAQALMARPKRWSEGEAPGASFYRNKDAD